MLRRRAVMALCAAGVAGCTDLVPGASDSTQTSGTATPRSESTPEARPIDCEGAARPEPEPQQDGSVEPLPYPEAPEGPVDVEWVADHEETYLRNRLITDDDLRLEDWHGFGVKDDERERHPDGAIVRIAYTYGYAFDRGVADSGLRTAAYYVNARGARRAASTGNGHELDSTLDPRTEGRTVVCF